MHQKITLFLVILLMLPLNHHSQSLEWAFNLGGHTDEYPTDIHKVPGGIILNSDMDGLRKYDDDGNLVWKFTHFNHTMERVFITSSDVDELGNIYAGLTVDKPAEYEIEVGGFKFQGGVNLVKINPQGQILWSRKIGGNKDMVKYHNKKVYISGNFLWQININDEMLFTSKEYFDCYSNINRHGADLYIARFSDIGVLENAIQYGNDYHDYASSIEINTQGDLFLAAMHEEYGCVTSFSYLLRFDKDLNLVWEKKVTTEERDENLISPLNLFLSENGKLYLVAKGIGVVENEEFTIPNTRGIWTFSLLEYDAATGDFLRINSYAKGNWNENFGPPHPYLNNMHLQEYKEDLIVFTSANEPLSFVNKEFIPQKAQENLLLFRVNKKDFTSHYITHFEAEIPDESYYAAIDNPGRTLIDGNNMYLTAAFQSSPLKMFGKEIPNNSGNNDRDILVAKLNLSALAKPGDDMDDDGDGVVNYKDYCPDTPPGTAVDANGCSALQLDSDGDGVINRIDECPNTRPGAPVNAVGCEILYLPADNFRISSTSESCVGKQNAVIRIEAANTSYNYKVKITGRNNSIAFTDVAEIKNLAEGTYEICITAEGYAEFERCYTLVIHPAESFDVFSVVDYSDNTVSFMLKGGELYTIIHNDRIIKTEEGEISLALEKGVNRISVSTEKACQGIYEEVVHGGNEILLYPNPVDEYFMLDLKSQIPDPVTVRIYTMGGQLLKTLTVNTENGKVKVDALALPAGTYLVQVLRNSGIESFKIIKR